MGQAERSDLLERYRAGAHVVEEALQGITADELDRRPPGAWSPRMVIHHLADSEANSYIRLRKLLAEEDTTLQGYDEAHWAVVLHYDRPVDASLAVFRGVRASSSELLDRLTEEDWARGGFHTESGPYSVTDWLRIYAAHGHDHAEQIRRARRGEA